MNKKDLVGMLGKVVLLVGLPVLLTTTFLYQEKQKQKIIENPATTIEYTVVEGDRIDNLLRQYSNILGSIDPRDVREYTKEISNKKTSSLSIGEKIKIPVYKK